LETTLATSLQVIAKLMRLHGLDPETVLLEAGVDPAALADPHARLPSSSVDVVLGAMASRIPSAAFGLDAARCWHPTNLGPLGHAWLCSSSLRRGLQRLSRYWALIGQRSALLLREEAGGVAVVLDLPHTEPRIAAITTDICFSVIVDMCRTNAGDAFAPLEVRLMRAAPADDTPWRAFHGCPIRFGRPERSLLLSRESLDAPLATSNRELAGMLDRMLDEALARIDRADVVARCRAVLMQRLASGEVTATQVARHLAMSRRTLHRRLADAGTSWQRLVDDTRRDVALRLIEDQRRPIGEITFELGFSQHSAFARAFKRWSGASPTAYRATLPGARSAEAPALPPAPRSRARPAAVVG
jgi:AraC-like DNA-binding protein